MRVLIVPNNENPGAVAATGELVAWLTAEGHEPVMLPEDAEAVDRAALGVPADALGAPALVVALGGDGTILRAVHALDGAELPILGVHMGRLGFLSGAEADEMTHTVAEALAGRARTERRVLLEAGATADGAEIGRYRALNEVYIGREAAGRVVDAAVAVNGHEILRFMCDGVIVATPTGSTAYALSVGGPIVSPEVRALVLVPVGAHTLASRPFVLGPEDVVEITFPNPARSAACLTVDGETVACSAPLTGVSVRLGAHAVPLVRRRDRDFYDVVRRKFLGG